MACLARLVEVFRLRRNRPRRFADRAERARMTPEEWAQTPENAVWRELTRLERWRLWGLDWRPGAFPLAEAITRIGLHPNRLRKLLKLATNSRSRKKSAGSRKCSRRGSG